MATALQLHEQVKDLDDEQWTALLLGSLRERSPGDISLPRWPTQDELRGSLYPQTAREHSILQAGVFVRHLKAVLGRWGGGLGPAIRLLDAGCGWGRIYRFLLKDVSPADLYGVDVDPILVAACRAALPPRQFDLALRDGSLPHPNGSFDLVFANSVLSHLVAEEHLASVAAWRRVLRPGGLLVASLLPGELIETHARQAEIGVLTGGPFTNIDDFPALRRSFDEHGFAWVSTRRRGERAGYGLAFVAEHWVRHNWPEDLELLAMEHFDDYRQSLAVARKAG